MKITYQYYVGASMALLGSIIGVVIDGVGELPIEEYCTSPRTIWDGALVVGAFFLIWLLGYKSRRVKPRKYGVPKAHNPPPPPIKK